MLRKITLLCALAIAVGAAAPCSAAAKGEKRAKVSMDERREQAHQAAAARRELAKQKAEERRLRNRSKAEKAADDAAAQQAEARDRHAAEMEEAAAQAKRDLAEQARRKNSAEQAQSAAVQNRLRHRKAALARFDVRPGEEWVTNTEGLMLFRLREAAEQYIRLAAESPEEAQQLLEAIEDDDMVRASRSAHLQVKATNSDSLLPTIGDLRDLPVEDETAAAFDTRTQASAYLKAQAESRGLIRISTRRKEEFWVLYRHLLELATPPEREEEPEEENQKAPEEEPDDGYEYGDDLV